MLKNNQVMYHAKSWKDLREKMDALKDVFGDCAAHGLIDDENNTIHDCFGFFGDEVNIDGSIVLVSECGELNQIVTLEYTK